MYVYLENYLPESDLWRVVVDAGAVAFKAYMTSDGVVELDANRVYLRHGCNLTVDCMKKFEAITGHRHPNLGGHSYE